MIKNMGSTDKIIRLTIAALIAVLYFTNMISGNVAMILGGLAIIFAATSFMSFCPLYFPFNINTNKKSKE